MKNNIISVVTATYNDALYIESAIKSVQNQSFKNWEMIIVNDGSIDDTEKIIKNLQKKDKRIKYYKNNKNRGAVYSLNRGIKLSKSKYIARIDGDDEWIDKNKLAKQIDFLESHKDIILLGTWGYKTDESGKRIAKIEYPIDDRSIRNYLLVENCFNSDGVVMRNVFSDKSDAYESNYQYAEDYALWLKLGTMGKLHNLPIYAVNYRTNPKGISMTKYNLVINRTIKLIKKYKKDYPHFKISLILWNSRRFIRRDVREVISSRTRRIIISRA